MTGSPNKPPKLTIGMATYDDFDGVYFSIQAIRMYHPEVLAACEFLVVDNHPGSASSGLIQKLAKEVPLRYVAFDELAGTAVKDIVIREARGEFVLCMDSHVFFAPGALKRLLDYFDRYPNTRDLLQGPLLRDSLGDFATHWHLKWSNGGVGVWSQDARGKDLDGQPFEIPAQGMGVFACRREAWPGYNPRFEGFAAEELYIHEKFRRAGGKCLCLPFLRWVHRFGRPQAPYRYADIDRFRNLMIAHEELGWSFAQAEAHWADLMGQDKAARLTQAVRVILKNPFYFFDAVYCIRPPKAETPWQETLDRLRKCRVRSPIRSIVSLDPAANAPGGRILTHREIVRRAKSRGWKSVAAFDEEISFDNDAVENLKARIADATRSGWSHFSFDGSGSETALPMQAVAYHESAFSRLLDELPR